MPEHVFVELDSGGSKYKLKYCGFGTYTCNVSRLAVPEQSDE